MAGYRELLAVEWNDNAVETFKLNFPDIPVYHGDIHGLTVEQCLELAGVEMGELGLLDGSPPCQGFSTAGKRQIDDKRNQLYMQFVRLLRGLQPKVFVMENVSGLVKGKMKLIFADIMCELKVSGYKVRCKLLNAKYFNVPQSRQRLIFIGVREDLGEEVSFPRAQEKPRTVREAIGKLCGSDIAPTLVRKTDKFASFMKDVKPGKTAGQYLGTGFNWTKARMDKPCPTLPKAVSWGGYHMVWHPEEHRNFSIREQCRLQSYPDSFVFDCNFKKASNHIGNSVPPLFMRAIANHIRSEILEPIRIESQ